MLHNIDCIYFMSNIICPCIHAWHVYDTYVSIVFSVHVEHNIKCISARNTAIQGSDTAGNTPEKQLDPAVLLLKRARTCIQCWQQRGVENLILLIKAFPFIFKLNCHVPLQNLILRGIFPSLSRKEFREYYSREEGQTVAACHSPHGKWLRTRQNWRMLLPHARCRTIPPACWG